MNNKKSNYVILILNIIHIVLFYASTMIVANYIIPRGMIDSQGFTSVTNDVIIRNVYE